MLEESNALRELAGNIKKRVNEIDSELKKHKT